MKFGKPHEFAPDGKVHPKENVPNGSSGWARAHVRAQDISLLVALNLLTVPQVSHHHPLPMLYATRYQPKFNLYALSLMLTRHCSGPSKFAHDVLQAGIYNHSSQMLTRVIV